MRTFWCIARFIRELLGLAGDIHFGWTAVKWVLQSAAVVGVVAAIVGWALSFFGWVSGLHPILYWGFYLCLAIVVFSGVNHARQGIPRWWARRGGITDEELKERCLKLCQEIYEFLADRERDEPFDRHTQAIRRAKDDEERQRLHDEYSVETHRYATETRVRYEQKFEWRVAGLVEQLEERGLIAPEHKWDFQHATNKMVMRDVAKRLGAICEK